MSTTTAIDYRAALIRHGFTHRDHGQMDGFQRWWEVVHPQDSAVSLIGYVQLGARQVEHLQFFTLREIDPLNAPGDPLNIALDFNQVHDERLLDTLIAGVINGFNRVPA